MLQRALAILAAMFLVGAVAVAALGPPNVPLGDALFMLDQDLLGSLESGLRAHLSQWMWSELVMPLLLRPAWLLPAVVGLLCAGVSMTLTGRHRAQRSSRRRF